MSVTGTLATTLGTLNPFRYRGYVFDEETGLYYLNARFYSPWLSRFCNADKQIGRNLFTYCDNCPVNKVDLSGCSGEKLPDFTYALNNELERQLIMEFESHHIGDGTDNSPGFAIRNLPTFLWFAGKMVDDGPISYKTDSVWNSTFPTLPSADKVSKFLFRGRETTREDFGNIAFGYLGSAIGLSTEYLLFGAGIYKQAKRISAKSNKTWTQALRDSLDDILEAVLYTEFWGNDRNDYEAIMYGIEQYGKDWK